MVHEAFRHFKPIAVIGDDQRTRDRTRSALPGGRRPACPGPTGVDQRLRRRACVEDIGWHRFWERDLATLDRAIG